MDFLRFDGQKPEKGQIRDLLITVCSIRCVYPLCIWGAVAQWIERATDNRVVARSNPTETAWKLWQFPLPHFASVFRKIH